MIPPVINMFRSMGSVPVAEYPVRIHEESKRVDVAAANWRSDIHLQAAAVECKLGSDWDAVGQALNQAIAYQTVFPEVYIAAQTSRDSLAHMETVLSDLGVGYIRVIDRETARIELEPSHNTLLNQTQFRLQVLNRLGRLVVCSKHWEGDIRSGRTDTTGFWIAGKVREKCNYLFRFQNAIGLRSGINFESTAGLRKFFSSTTPVDLCDVLKRLPQDAEIVIHDFITDSLGRKTPASKTKESHRWTLHQLQLEDVERIIKHAKDRRYYIWLLVVRERSIMDEQPTQGELEREVIKLEKEFGELYDYILSKIYTRKRSAR